ncbi:hypothetical protein F53441_11931 [Fusarium austroafricanum]|uniref:Reverse transcriptase domain-containing protein n=1 Tax=Fusarium austroafricanum TaxID=2364996 RepID=A0A8H4K3D0_9HYPO|nr:hypothetical protein F53441_11931 [Fusarium austroafricanum]
MGDTAKWKKTRGGKAQRKEQASKKAERLNERERKKQEEEEDEERNREEGFRKRESLIIDQANFLGSLHRTTRLLNCEQERTNGRMADIICGCDPSPTSAWRRNKNYWVEMNPTRALVASDNPNDPNRPKRNDKRNKKAAKQQKKAVEFSSVFFFIHKSIPRSKWNVVYHDDANAGMAATLYLMTSIGEIAIHNVYNVNQPATTDQPPRRIDVDILVDRTTASGRDIVVGDFNLHDPAWSGHFYKEGSGTGDARKLQHGMMTKAQMKLLTVPGSPTWSHSIVGDDPTATEPPDQESRVSCIDLTFISPDLVPRFKSWGIFRYNPWEKSDHRPIRTVIDINPARDDTKKLLWNECDEKVFLEEVGKKVELWELLACESQEQLNLSMAKISKDFLELIEKVVPSCLLHPPPPEKPMDPQTRNILQGNDLSSGESLYELFANLRDKFRSYIQTCVAKDGYHKAIGIGKVRNRSAIVQTMPSLADSSGKDATSEVDKQSLIRASIFPDTSDIGERATSITFPTFDPNVKELPMNQYVKKKDVERILRTLRYGKAAGPDGIPNEALRKGWKILAPLLTKIFNQCLKLGCHLDTFKIAITAMLPKAGKDDHKKPNSWRPIALLSSIGKVFERVLADLLKKCALDNNLIPRTQYGAPGKSTVQAVHEIVDIVHKAWSRKEKRKLKKKVAKLKNKVTMLGLDISGAFNCVNPAILLQALANMGIPKWFIRIIHSFLSDRRTVLRLPQSVSKPFRINIGIPQGSPLSPILFMLFTAPLLELIEKHNTTFGDNGITVHCISYVDDTYLIAVSDSYEKNCSALKSFHDVVLEWANRVGLEFSPHKYSVMHFQRRGGRDPPSTVLPDIDGLKDNPECLKQTQLKVLGVVLDPKLTFEHHCIRAGVGVTLAEARDWYFSHIRSKIGYACGAWFMRSPGTRLDGSFVVTQLKRLEKLHYKCLLSLSGAISTTTTEFIEKDVNVESIEAFLTRTMLTYRAKSLALKGPLEDQDPDCNRTAYRFLDEQAMDLVKAAKQSFRASRRINDDDDETFEKLWGEKHSQRNRAIKKILSLQATDGRAKSWIYCRQQHAGKHRSLHVPAVMVEDAGPQSLKYYKGMTRAESTLGLQLRTECIGLNGYLSKIRAPRYVRVAGSKHLIREFFPAACTCGYHTQTVFHMFMECPDLDVARARLIEHIGAPLKWDTLLTTNLKKAVHWAMTYFGIPQYALARLDSDFHVDDGGS